MNHARAILNSWQCRRFKITLPVAGQETLCHQCPRQGELRQSCGGVSARFGLHRV